MMDKNIKSFIVLTIALLNPIFISSNANAGFYDWLASKEIADELPAQRYENYAASFDNFYKWTKIVEVENNKPKFKVLKTHTVRATGYSSTPDQTDSTPFITASGTYVRDGIIAANFYVNGRRIPFGTLVRIPEIYGDKIFIVEDRMNARYKNNIDVWFSERDLAREFGSKKLTIEIVEES